MLLPHAPPAPALALAPASALATPTSATACTPGQNGVPGSPIGDLLCGRYLTDTPADVWHWGLTRWPLLAAGLTAVVVARLGWVAWRRRAWRRYAAQARWLEIVPPVTATPAATVHLWRLIATLLPAPRRLTPRPARLVWEAYADPTGMRAGLWVPPGINPAAVTRVVQRAWPGARVAHAHRPRLPRQRPVAGLALAATVPEWQPFIDDPPPTSSRREGGPVELDRQRAIYDGLAAAGRTGGGLLQVIAGRAPRRRVVNLRRAATNPARAHHARRSLRILIRLAETLRAALLAVLDFLTPGSSAAKPDGTRVADPYQAEVARQARSKYATAPHLLVAVHAIAAGPTTAAARAAAADITSGYGLLSGRLTRRRLWHPRAAAFLRWAPEARMLLATAAETAALAGLPAEPATFGLPAAAARHRLPGRDTWRPTDANGSRQPFEPRQSTRAARAPNHADDETTLGDGGLFTIEEGERP